MHRLFETSSERRQFDLDGEWSFLTDPDDEGHADNYPTAFPLEEADRLHVPCAWTAVPRYYDYEGPAWYRTVLHVPETTNGVLSFGAVAHDATVYLDGELLGEHYGAYTPFHFFLEELTAGDHELVVRVDNTHSDETIPKPHVDWAHQGGIIRPVRFEAVGDVVVHSVRAEYDLTDEEAVVTPVLDVHAFAPGEYAAAAVIDESETTDTVALEAGDTRVSLPSIPVADPDCWSPNDPTLYELLVEFGGDERRERIGFRTVEVTDTDILVNGEPVDIAGVNRHEDHPDWGHAVPPRLVAQDVDIIQRAGLNGVRTSHYPNDPLFLDYCDREGLLVIEEIPYWHFEAEDFEKDIVLNRGKRMLAEMIERDYNHPAVFAWSLHNECETQEEGVAAATETLADVARAHDETRPITYATNKHYLGDEENSADPIDFLSINGYWGWYSEEREWGEFLDSIREEFPEMPMIVTEFGAGAIAGTREFDRRMWSEELQSDVLETAITTFDQKEFVAGYYIWQFCDTDSSDDLVTSRPNAQNNKGIVDEYRHPKDGYWTVTRLLEE